MCHKEGYIRDRVTGDVQLRLGREQASRTVFGMERRVCIERCVGGRE